MLAGETLELDAPMRDPLQARVLRGTVLVNVSLGLALGGGFLLGQADNHVFVLASPVDEG